MVNLKQKLTEFLGVSHRDETDSDAVKHQGAWQMRRNRLLSRRCGKLAPNSSSEICGESDLSHTNKDGRQETDKDLSRVKRQTYHPEMVPESKNATTIDNSNLHEVVIGDSDIEAREYIKATYKTETTHPPMLRATSDTAINHTTVGHTRKQHEYELDPNKHSKSAYDLTDHDFYENIVKLVNDVLVRHQPKRAFGMGLVGNLLSRKFRKDLNNAQLNAIYSFNDHRPYFTYWVTTVQILILIITLFTYGFGPFGLSRTLVRGVVYVSSLTNVNQDDFVPDNIWLGPRPQDLIHLGAKFTPCMRKDTLIYQEIVQDREAERTTGCCIRNDESKCLQTQREHCSSLSEWHFWNDTVTTTTTGGSTSMVVAPPIMMNDTNTKRTRTSGPVCGQDPRYCLNPASNYPHEWPDDITKWPICHESKNSNLPKHHMSCELVGRPCCIGIYGQCRITTSQHCQFLRGTFHPEATLCSQVSCMEDVCGMMPFYARDYPDQFYRLITALFLHAGLIHLCFTVIIQYYIMRDIERLLGSTRMAIIYILPGVAGYLASATFVPYHTQVGPSGSQFALLACLVAETINGWNLLDDPMGSLKKLSMIACSLFVLGLLPWIDNYAHIFGFIVGLLLALALTPYLTLFSDSYSRRKKVIQIWVCIVLVILIFVLLPLPLYIFPLYECSWCQYLDCWPLAPHWCENQDIKVPRLNLIF